MGVKLYLPHSTGCFVCGEENSFGLDLRFYVEDGSVRAALNIPRRFCGFSGVVHGGIISAMLDEAMGWSAAVFGAVSTLCFTRNLEVKFRKNVPAETPLLLDTRFTGRNRLFFEAVGEIKDAAGAVYASGKGQFVTIAQEKMDETMGYLRMEENLTYHPLFLELYRKWKNTKS